MTKTNDSAEYAQDLELLLTEVAELLSATEENLVALEKAPSDTSLIQEVFRVMHTVKGGAATLGLQEAVDVTHGMETLLDDVRAGVRPLTRPLMDVLFSVMDYLKEWRSALMEKREVQPASTLLARIHALEKPGDGPVPAAQDATATRAGFASLPEDLGAKVEAAAQQGKNVYRLKVRFGTDVPLLSVRCFQILTIVQESVEVAGSVPSLEEIENDKVGDVLDIYVVTDDSGEEARNLVQRSQDVKTVTLTRYQAKAPKAEASQGEADPATPVVKRSDLGKTVRVDVRLLDFLMNMVGELVIDRTRLSQIAAQLMRVTETTGIGNDVNALASHLQRTSTELQEGIMQARLLPLRSILTKFPRMMRDLSQRCGKQITFEMAGESTELDRTVLEAIDDPLIHILRNAVDHGIELPQERVARGKSPQGRVRLSASHEENQVLVRVEDDGAGIDADKIKRSAIKKGLLSEEAAAKLTEKEAVEMIFLPGFSTAEVATEVSGRGVGMDVVHNNLEKINGQIEVKTKVGMGTLVTLRLPLTLAIMRALLVKCGGAVFAIPTSSVEEVLSTKGMAVGSIQGKLAMSFRGRVVPLVSLEGALKDSMWSMNPHKYALLTRTNEQPLALGVDDLIGEEEIVVKEMGRLLSRLKGIAGATILAQGDPAIILDLNRVI